jgi:hypothetical protein
MFKPEFAPEQIHLDAWRAESAPVFLDRLMADAVAELLAINAVDSCGPEWERQFCGPRSVEAFRAFNTARHLRDVFVADRELVAA